MEIQTRPAQLDVKVRNILKPGDLGSIAAIHGKLYADECGYGLNFEAYVLKGLSEFAQNFDSTKDQVWICECDGRIVGCLFAQHRPNAVQLRYFILLPEFRGMGLGKKLMTEFINFIYSNVHKSAYLWTTDEQESATALYEKYGFMLTEEKQSEEFGKVLTERKYELALR
jgi:ribosomal protein S18 acetylase RimI-like enzyme